jgi:hypothetical protein
MARLTLVLAAWIGMATAATASLAPRQDPLLPRKAVAALDEAPTPTPPAVPAARASAQADGQGARSGFVVTDRTEILLNGQPCNYQQVPAQARIVQMEVAADQKTVLKVHFRTR